MPKYEQLDPTPRRALHVFYVLDTSGSMNPNPDDPEAGSPIATLNNAMRETTKALKQVAESNADAELKIAVMSFNSEPQWMDPVGPVDMEDFIWEDLTAGGLTQTGAALKELDSKLHQSAFLKSMTGAYMPIIIFMSDGYPTDNYKKELDIIRRNPWFNRATKIGFALGEGADQKVMAELVGNREAVIRTTDLGVFAKLIQFVSVTSSIIRSHSSTESSSATGADVVDDAKNQGLITKDMTLDDDIQYDQEVVYDDPDWQ